MELGSPALTDYDGGSTELLSEAGRIAAVLQRDAELFNRSSVDPAEVALLLSMRTYLWTGASTARAASASTA